MRHRKPLKNEFLTLYADDAKSCTADTIPILRGLLKDPAVVAVGECGLDFDRNFSPPAVQEQWFEEQVKLAVDIGKPLFLHERSAHARFCKIMAPYAGKVRAVVHCFTGSRAELETYLSMGFYIGITGWVADERRGGDLLDHAFPQNNCVLVIFCGR